ncbi:hypothetical protein M3Y99_01613500 [Aphelenchoides fujianensis]|nr:hypothetical protein M3Y99_01613500 [Aphelenchoides fujianensis]
MFNFNKPPSTPATTSPSGSSAFGGFGGAPSPGVFASPASATTSASSLFGQPSAGGSSLFGKPAITTAASSSSSIFAASAAAPSGVFGGGMSASAASSGNSFGGDASAAPTAGSSSFSTFSQPTAAMSKIFERPAPTPAPYAGLKVAPPARSSYAFAGSFGGSSIPAVAPTPAMFPSPSPAATTFASAAPTSAASPRTGASALPSAPVPSCSSTGGFFGAPAASSTAVSQPPASSGQPSTTKSGLAKPLAVRSKTALPASSVGALQPTAFRELDSSLNKMIAGFEHYHLAFIQNLEEFDRRLQQLEEEKDAFCVDVRMVSEMQAGLAEELSRLEEAIELPLAEPTASNTVEQKRLAALNLLSDVAVQFDEMEAELEEASELLHEVGNAEESGDDRQTVENLEQIRRILRSQWTSVTNVEKEADLLAERVQQHTERATHLH